MVVGEEGRQVPSTPPSLNTHTHKHQHTHTHTHTHTHQHSHLLSALPFLYLSEKHLLMRLLLSWIVINRRKIIKCCASSKRKYFIVQKHFQLDNFYAFPKAIFHASQRLGKLEYLCSNFVYSMPDDAVYCVERAMFFICEERKVLRFFSQQGIKGLHENQILNIGNL